MKIILILICIFVLTSCDLLTTRDPEEPDSPRSNFVTPTTPDLLFSNLINSFKEKIVENYIACFVDNSFLDVTYTFTPSAGSVAQFTILNDWDINAERQYFNNLKTLSLQNAPIVIQLNDEVKNTQGNSAVYQYTYSISVPFESENTIYKGNAIFSIHLDSRNNWVITKCEDIRIDDFPSWSELRGKYY